MAALLSKSSAKIDKSNKFDSRYLSYILYLSPARLSGYQTCPNASAGCAAACLNTAGMGVFSNVQKARMDKTKYLFENRPAFLTRLASDIESKRKQAKRLGKKLVIRLNGTSDLPWEAVTFGNLIAEFPDVQFYDYTKSYSRMVKFINGEMPENYHLTFSLSEVNFSKALDILAMGGNVAMVFGSEESKKDRKFPSQWLGYKIVDGDSHDLRFLDKSENQKGLIVGLWAKGKARKDNSDFVLRLA